jgi:hypothetical protein
MTPLVVSVNKNNYLPRIGIVELGIDNANGMIQIDFICDKFTKTLMGPARLEKLSKIVFTFNAVRVQRQ